MAPQLAFHSIFLVLASLFTAPAATQGNAVAWTDAVNATASGTILQKTFGCDGCDDAGAMSQQEISAPDGYVEFTVGELSTLLIAGLSRRNSNTFYVDIDFAFRFDRGYADVLERGIYQPGGDTTYVPGDRFRVGIVGGRVGYYKNGTLLRESAAAPEYPLVLDASLFTMGATIRDAVLTVTPPPPPGSGVLEKSGSPALRPRFTRADIDAFLPAAGAKGAFTFPPPYNTAGVRLSNESDCAATQDCIAPVGYSYWRNTNNHIGNPFMYVFLGTDRNRGGVGPALVQFNKLTDEVMSLNPLFDVASPYSYSTGEGWYFSATRPNSLYTFLVGGTQLRRYDIATRQFDPAAALDLRKCPRPKTCGADAVYITQPHSSDDDRVHSATVQNASWERLGCVVRQETPSKYAYFPTPTGYQFDECHVDKSGRWLLILELRPDGGRRNRIVDLRKGHTTVIDAEDGALGHLDMGFGYAVGADTFSLMPNASILLKFPVSSTRRPVGPVVHFNKRWEIAAANHVAHGNASVALPPESQYVCGTNASRVPDMADEIVCFSLDSSRNSDGSLDVLAVTQVMTDLDALGGEADGSDYGQLPKGNLDVTGTYFIWTTNLGGDRLDAFLVKVPAERLAGSSGVPLRRGKR